MSSESVSLRLNSSLWLLHKMNSRGAIKRFIRNLLTFHGIVTAGISFAYFFLIICHRNDMGHDFYPILARFGWIGLTAIFLLCISSGLAGAGIFDLSPKNWSI